MELVGLWARRGIEVRFWLVRRELNAMAGGMAVAAADLKCPARFEQDPDDPVFIVMREPGVVFGDVVQAADTREEPCAEYNKRDGDSYWTV